jgi:5-methylcytosine-specific restriction endonuclease McrA
VTPKQNRRRRKRQKWRKLCEEVWEKRSRDGGTWAPCANCAGSVLGYEAQFHHKIFKSQGGQDTEENVDILCLPCHERRHGRHRSRE